MKSAIHMISISASIIVLVMLISVLIYTKNSTVSLSIANNNQLQQERQELETSGLEAYENDNITGSQVIAAIRKYKDDYNVSIISGSTGNVIEQYNHSKSFRENRTNIDRNKVYSGELVRNAVGNITAINFTSVDLTGSDGTIVFDNPDDARSFIIGLAREHGLNDNSTWNDIENVLQDNLTIEGKQIIVSALEGSTYSSADTFLSLAQAAASKIETLNNEVNAKRKYFSSDVYSIGDEFNPAFIDSYPEIGFEPAVVIVKQYDNINTGEDVYFWYMDNTNISESGFTGIWIGKDGSIEPDNLKFGIRCDDNKYYFCNYTGNKVNVIAYGKN